MQDEFWEMGDLTLFLSSVSFQIGELQTVGSEPPWGGPALVAGGVT